MKVRKAAEVGLLFPTRLEQLLCHFASSDVALYFVCACQRTQRRRCQRDADSPKEVSQASLVTRPGFSFKEPRRAASAGLVRKVKIYHISGGLRDLDGFGGARIVYLNDVMSYFKYIIG